MTGIVKSTANTTILIVEDDPAIRDEVADCLRAEGYRPALAAGFQEGVDALAHTRFALVLADAAAAGLAHPGAHRPAILEHVYARAGYSPLIIFTASRDGDLAGLRARGFDELVLKPFDLDQLLISVREALARGA